MSFCSWRSEEIYCDHWKSGIYECSQCSHPLFASNSKFSHHSPWPAFTQTIAKHSVAKKPDMGSSMALKVSCGKCGNGLGHEFIKGGPDQQSRF